MIRAVEETRKAWRAAQNGNLRAKAEFVLDALLVVGLYVIAAWWTLELLP